MKPECRARLGLLTLTILMAACGDKGSTSSSNVLPDLPDLPTQHTKVSPAPVPQSQVNTAVVLPSLQAVAPKQPATPPVETPVALATPPSTATSSPEAPAATVATAKPVKFARSNSVAADYSRYALGQGKYFESLVAQLEGYRQGFYRDNIGVAVGFGYNTYFQSREKNKKAGIDVLKSEQAAQTLMSLTKNNNPGPLPSIAVNPEQAMAMSLMLKPDYEDPMRGWIPGFESLKPNQKAVLVYHSYKLGGAGAQKYSVLKQKIALMLANPTPENIKSAGAQFQYTYKVGGETKTDTRSTIYMQALWNDPAEAYAALIGGKSSTFVATLPEFKNSGKTSISEDDIADPIGEVKAEMERTGRRIPITLEVPRPRGQGIILPNF